MPRLEADNTTPFTITVPDVAYTAIKLLARRYELPDTVACAQRLLRLGINTQVALLRADIPEGDFGNSIHVDKNKHVSHSREPVLSDGELKSTRLHYIQLHISDPDVLAIHTLQQLLYPDNTFERTIAFLITLGMQMEAERLGKNKPGNMLLPDNP